MSEWLGFLATAWLFWSIDGLRILPQGAWSFAAQHGCARARAAFGRWQLPPWSPWGWRLIVADPPVALSPRGVLARPVGAAGRPQRVRRAAAIAWEQVGDVRTDGRWLWINGARFAPDSGHVTARELREIAASTPPERAAAIKKIWSEWLRIDHARRWRRVWLARTADAALCNALLLGIGGLVTVWLLGALPDRQADLVQRLGPGLAATGLVAHAWAIGSVSRARRRLGRAPSAPAGSPLLLAALFPPQALRLRSIAGEAGLRRAHPVAIAVAFGQPEAIETLVRQAFGDLRWPIDGAEDDPLGQEIAAWHRAGLAKAIEAALRRAGIPLQEILRAPRPDGAESVSYCPRCRAQFVEGPKVCPHGVPLEPLARR